MLEYRKISENDITQVIELYETYLNSGTFISNSIRENFHAEDFLGFQACEDGKMVGFFTGQGGIGFTYPQPELEKEIFKFVGTKKVYTPDGLFVLEEYRGRGIAGKLIELMKKRLIEEKVELALVELWIYPDGTIPAQDPLRGIGKPVFQKKVPMFYKGLKKYAIKCPLCGDDCTCGALIQLLEIKGDGDE